MPEGCSANQYQVWARHACSSYGAARATSGAYACRRCGTTSCTLVQGSASARREIEGAVVRVERGMSPEIPRPTTA